MGFRVRRRARILPGLSLNLSKSGHSSLPAREGQAGHTRYGQRIGGKISRDKATDFEHAGQFSQSPSQRSPGRARKPDGLNGERRGTGSRRWLS